MRKVSEDYMGRTVIDKNGWQQQCRVGADCRIDTTEATRNSFRHTCADGEKSAVCAWKDGCGVYLGPPDIKKGATRKKNGNVEKIRKKEEMSTHVGTDYLLVRTLVGWGC